MPNQPSPGPSAHRPHAPLESFQHPAPGPAGGLKAFLRAVFPPVADWKKAAPAFAFAAVSALLLRLAYLPFHWSPLAFVALVPLLWGLRKCRPGMAFWVGLLWGAINGAFATGWLVVIRQFNPAVLAGIVPLALWLGVHAGVACAAIVAIARKLPPWIALAGGALVWAGMEYFKMIGALGLPYNLLAHSQGGWPAMAQAAALGGMPLLGALVFAVNLAVMESVAATVARYGQGGAYARLGATLALADAVCAWGYARIASLDKRFAAEGFDFSVALLQTGIDQPTKLESYSSPDTARRAALQDELTRLQLDQIGEVQAGEADLIVTPESSFTQDFFDVEAAQQRRMFGGAAMLEAIRLAKELRTPIVVGAVDFEFRKPDGSGYTEYLEEAVSDKGTIDEGYRTYGGLWLLRPSDEGIQHVADYRKVHLMPFGETVPYFGLIPGFQQSVVGIGSFAPGTPIDGIGMLTRAADGKEPREVKLGPSICFDDLFPGIHRRYANAGVHLLVNATNDAWYDGSPGAAWHADAARWRSIETGLPMVRATNTGLTQAFDFAGRATASLEPGARGVLKAKLRLLPGAPLSPYARIGNLFGIVALIAGVALVLVAARTREA